MSSKIVLNFKTKENFQTYVMNTETGYSSAIMFSSWLCGYIKIPLQNSKYIKDIYYLNVHGGITYESYSDYHKHLILGFDCAHYNDTPMYIKNSRNIGFCKNELIKLSKQINKLILKGRKKLVKNKIKELRKINSNK